MAGGRGHAAPRAGVSSWLARRAGSDQRGDALRNAIRAARLEHAPHLLGRAVTPAAGADEAGEDEPGVEQDLVALVFLALASQEEPFGCIPQHFALVVFELGCLELVEDRENPAVGLVAEARHRDERFPRVGGAKT